MSQLDYQTTNLGSGSSAADIDLTLNLGAGGGNKVITVFLMNFSGAATIVGAEVNGNAMTAYTPATATGGKPAQGFTFNTTLTGNVTVRGKVSAADSTYHMVAQAEDGVSGVRNLVANAHPTTTHPSSTLTTVAGDLVLAFGNDDFNGTTITPTAPAGVTGVVTAGSNSVLRGAATGASTTIGGTLSAGSIWRQVAVALIPAAGGTNQDLAGAATAQATATGNLSVGSANGTLTTPPLKNNAGTLLANETGATVHVYSLAGGLVVTKTAQTTNAAGVMAVTDASIVVGTTYRLVVVLASAAEGLAKLTAT